jgi:hypothetical protein
VQHKRNCMLEQRTTKRVQGSRGVAGGGGASPTNSEGRCRCRARSASAGTANKTGAKQPGHGLYKTAHISPCLLKWMLGSAAEAVPLVPRPPPLAAGSGWRLAAAAAGGCGWWLSGAFPRRPAARSHRPKAAVFARFKGSNTRRPLVFSACVGMVLVNNISARKFSRREVGGPAQRLQAAVEVSIVPLLLAVVAGQEEEQ